MPSATTRRITRAGIVILAIFVLLAAWVAWEIFRAFTAEPAITVDYGAEMVELAERHQPPGENGWDVLLELIEMYERVEAEVLEQHRGTESIDFEPIWATPNGDLPLDDSMLREQREAMAPALQALAALEQAGALPLHDRLAGMPRFVRPAQEGPLLMWLLPEIGAIRRMSNACIGRMHLRHDAGDDPALVASFEHALALARVAGSQATLIDHLVAIATVELAVHELRAMLLERMPEAAALRGLVDAMDRQLPLPPVSLGCEGERLMALDSFQRTHAANGRLLVNRMAGVAGDGGFTEETLPSPLHNLAGIYFARRPDLEQKLHEYLDACIAESAKTRSERRLDSFDPEAFIGALSKRYAMLILLLPAVHKVIYLRDEHEMEIAGTRLMLAIELHRATTGAYPDALADLVPTTIASLPADPYSREGFRYRRLEPPDDEGRHYLLYSVAADGEDDGGATLPFNPRQAVSPVDGYDRIINARTE